MQRPSTLFSGNFDTVSSREPGRDSFPYVQRNPPLPQNPEPGFWNHFSKRPVHMRQDSWKTRQWIAERPTPDTAPSVPNEHPYLHPISSLGDARSNGGIAFFNDPRNYPEDGSGSELYPSTEFGSLNAQDSRSQYPPPSPHYAPIHSRSNSYLSIRDDSSVAMDQQAIRDRSFYPLPPLPEREEKHSPKHSPTASSKEQSSAQTDDYKAELLRKRRKGRACVILVAVVVVAAVIAMAVTVGILIGNKETGTDETEVKKNPQNPPDENSDASIAYLREPALMDFTIPYPPQAATSFRQLKILHNGHGEIASFNWTGNNSMFTHPRMLVDTRTESDFFRVIVTLLAVRCEDAGRYVVVAMGDGVSEENGTAIEVVKRPSVPVLRLPERIAEGHTVKNPVCSVSSLGYPPLKFSWVLRRPGRNDGVFPDSLYDNDIRTDKDACVSEGSSTLDAQNYVGWNSSELCCQLRTTDSDEVYMETCQRVLTIPADYCSSGDTLKAYPYEPCYSFVTCQNNVVGFNSCPTNNGFCIDVGSETCSRPAPISVNPPPSSGPTNPYSCSEQSSPYLPLQDTYPNNCHKFQRCVGDTSVSDSCDDRLEFLHNGTSDVVCSLPSEHTYCGQLILNQNVTVVSVTGGTGQIEGNVSLQCEMKDIHKLSKVTFLLAGAHVASLNVTDMTQVVTRTQTSITGERRGTGREEEFAATLTLANVSCSDGGVYTCVAGDGEHEDQRSATLLISREPQAPILEIPADLVEGRTVRKPTCRAPYLGYNPSMQFGWTLRRPDGSVETLPLNRHTDSNSKEDCNTVGTSVLDSEGYVSWNGSELCCKLLQVKANGSVSTEEETCQRLFVLPAVEMDPADSVVAIGQSYNVACLARNVSGNTQVEILRNNQKLAEFNTTTLSGTSGSSSRVTVDGRLDDDLLTVTFNLSQVTCSDGGSYTCSVDDGGVTTSAAVTLSISRSPSKPQLTVPDAAEGHTALNPTCEVTSLGFNPVMTLTWLLTKSDGSKETLSSASDVTVDSANCNSHLSSPAMVDAERYVGWNDSVLCCQLRHPDTSAVVEESCQNILLVPENYCASGEQYLPHPYEPCAKFVQCAGRVVYVSKCGPNTCFDLATIQCKSN